MAGSFAKVGLHGAVLDTRMLDRITAEMRPKARRIVAKYGYAIAASAATEHPWKLDTGNLTNTILAESKMTDDMTFTVQDATDYWVYLEFGTSRMPAYPSLTPAIEKWSQPFQDAFAELFK